MTNRPTLLTDVAELRNVLRAMDEWEAAGEELDSTRDRRRFVEHLDDQATDELAGLALANLARAVMRAKTSAGETHPPRDGSSPAVPTPRSWQRSGDRHVVAA